MISTSALELKYREPLGDMEKAARRAADGRDAADRALKRDINRLLDSISLSEAALR